MKMFVGPGNVALLRSLSFNEPIFYAPILPILCTTVTITVTASGQSIKHCNYTEYNVEFVIYQLVDGMHIFALKTIDSQCSHNRNSYLSAIKTEFQGSPFKSQRFYTYFSFLPTNEWLTKNKPRALNTEALSPTMHAIHLVNWLKQAWHVRYVECWNVREFAWYVLWLIW